MLGYKGRSGRREFMAAAGLLFVGPEALSMLVKPSIPWVFSTFERSTALTVALLLTLVTCAAIIVWFWGWTALTARRARDIGGPAWAGVLSLVVLVAISRWMDGFPPPYALISSWGVTLIWLAVLSAWPSATARPDGDEARDEDIASPSPA